MPTASTLSLNTVAAKHDLNPFLDLLRRDGTLTLVGAPEHDHPSPQVFNLILKRPPHRRPR
ncbi:Uncharacterized zinc-type alcohol dehydrogenase-like protein YahK [Serratia rubidaea]|uniref:Uncharacterized zinc-type alcohol dehydrogenase-like protein YahK n=1 Tax=Serratia rubidaea TaxID=61652 RepID=A0A4U9HTD6_SERRU|nr:Uncharacterized zinc-type alcohol dehydrogenase-like protein YahK [Serratia rubidaea]